MPAHAFGHEHMQILRAIHTPIKGLTVLASATGLVLRSLLLTQQAFGVL